MTNIGWIISLASLVVALLGIVAALAIKINKGESASAKADRVERDLAEFKIKVASDYATASMVAAVERTVSDAFNRLSDRIDRLLETRPSTRPRPRAD